MSAAISKPELVRDGLPSNVAEAAIRRMEEDAHIIRGLRMQNDRLKDEKLNVELEASVAIATAKLGQAQAFQKVKELEDNLNELRNWITGNVAQKDELAAVTTKLDQVASDYYTHSARSDC